MTGPLGPGTLVAVVGASGVGKDSIIDWARSRSAAIPGGPVFPRRAVTRPAGPGEEHICLDDAAFHAAESRGGFAVSWRAHGLAYGIPVAADETVAAGGVVVVNVSRAVLPGLAARYARLRVVRVVVPEDVRRTRLATRGREEGDAADARIARADPAPGFPADLEIVNDGTIERAGRTFLAFLDALRDAAADPS